MTASLSRAEATLTLSPKGDRVAAFFDLDGTLLPLPSLERRFVSFLFERGSIGPGRSLRWLGRFVSRLFAFRRIRWQARWLAATDGNKRHLAGIAMSSADVFVARFAHRRLRFFPDALRRVAWHVAQEHSVYLITGSLTPLAVAAAWQLARRLAEIAGRKPPAIRVCATEPDEAHGRWTGEVRGETMIGEAKARAVRRLAREDGIELSRSFAYGDRLNDCPMVECVGHPVVVNASHALARLARRRDWQQLDWTLRQKHRDAKNRMPNLRNGRAKPIHELSSVVARMNSEALK